ncbi:glycoside hydrolase family 72 protein [Aplosporella prunicola CBS 121167]|uniref:1,3-beta-glucanosyltransferase n=1 Tax=Aplosporella prunicola CBS 121167 TaxID=1176127 RepID=A0A6A6BK84_9PEZI|nr:glycoside hydrolase family 72 protein [Aplosporella prunicola CBS 121167]KAF2143745.1 glycoside hydrolase family 72 protein [Aplosporella prunicola CBS 121167]
MHTRYLLGSLLTGAALAVNTVEIKNQDFVDSKTGKRHYIIGVDYQPGGQSGYDESTGKDPLTDDKACLRDASIMQNLGINTIRIYNIDPNGDHDKCASIFNAAGIYMLLDVNSPFSGGSINRAEPWTSYNDDYLTRIFKMVEAFKDYPNTLGFFAGNELINDVKSSKINPPYMRAVQRDLKTYIKNHADRQIPVGYSAAQVQDVLEDTWQYLQCAVDGKKDEDMSRADFFGLNSYSWCGGDATFQSSGYSDLVDMFKESSIPVFFSEYGCNEVKPRVFNEVQALYGDKMTSLSGGLVYEYSWEESEYGLVTINDNNTISLRTDFENLQKQFNKLDLSLIQSANATGTSITPPECATKLISDKNFNSGIDEFKGSWDLPSTPSKAAKLLKEGVQNANKGKIVKVSDTEMPYAVYSSGGSEIKGLKLSVLEDGTTNSPGGNSLNSGDSTTKTGNTGKTTTSDGSASSTTKQGAAGKIGVQSTGALIFAAILAIYLC